MIVFERVIAIEKWLLYFMLLQHLQDFIVVNFTSDIFRLLLANKLVFKNDDTLQFLLSFFKFIINGLTFSKRLVYRRKNLLFDQ